MLKKHLLDEFINKAWSFLTSSPLLLPCFLSESNGVDNHRNTGINSILFLRMAKSWSTPSQPLHVIFYLSFLHFLHKNTIALQPSSQRMSRNSFEKFTMKVENETETIIFFWDNCNLRNFDICIFSLTLENCKYKSVVQEIVKLWMRIKV